MKWVLWVIDDLGLLLEPLVQRLEVNLDKAGELGIECFRDNERVDGFVVDGEYCGGGLDPGYRGCFLECGNGEERGLRNPVLREPFMFPD
jgi:hypothetical protein